MTRGKRGISALGKTNVILDQSLQSENQNVSRYSVLKKGGKNQSSHPDLQEVKKEGEESPADNSFYGIFTSLIGGSKKTLKPNATQDSKIHSPVDTHLTSQMEEMKRDDGRDSMYSSQVKTPSLLDLASKKEQH